MTRISTPHRFALAITLVLISGVSGCSRPAETTPEVAPAAPAVAAPAAEPEYEPAYPADVSSEGLTEKDAEQQAMPHSHDGGEGHAHGENEEDGDHGHPH